MDKIVIVAFITIMTVGIRPNIKSPSEVDIKKDIGPSMDNVSAQDPCMLDVVVCDSELDDVQTTRETVEDENSSIAQLTAYTASIDECDGNPFITADGTDNRTFGGCIVAHKSLPFGTIIRIPELGLKCEVHDRMPKKALADFDIFMNSKEEALQFGRQNLEVIIESNL